MVLAGRGFALVAAEMRRLAERVTGTVNDVHEAATASTVVATQESRELAQSTAEAARQISAVTLRQSKDTEQASIDVHSVAEMVAAAASATTETRAAAEGLRRQAAELERLIGQFELDEARSPS